MNSRTLLGRLERGLNAEQAVGLSNYQDKNKKSIKVFGKKYKSLKSAASTLGVKYSMVQQRLKRGINVDQAFSNEVLKKTTGRERKIKVNNLSFSSLKEAGEHFGINYQKLRYRLQKNWAIEQVFGLRPPPENTAYNAPKKISFRGINYKSVSALSKAYNLSDQLVQNRFNIGWTIEEALELEIKTYASKPSPVTVEGKKFQSRNDAARHYGINIGTVATRVNKMGWSIEQALELTSPPEGFHTEYGAVYLISNANSNKKYVGITLQNPPSKRFEEHFYRALEGKRVKKGSLHEAMRTEDKDHFKFSVLKTATTQGDLQKLEKAYIKKLKTLYPNGYNLSPGGSIFTQPGRSLYIKSLNKKFKSIAEASRFFKVKAGTIQDRLSRGCSDEQSVGLEPITYKNAHKKITIEGRTFSSLSEAAIEYGLEPRMLIRRLNDGWSIKKAMITQ